MANRLGRIVIFSGPSGVGKSQVISGVRAQLPRLRFSVSHTTRPKRESEVHGREYYFIDQEHFRLEIARGAFIEWAVVHDELYGTSKRAVIDMLKCGIDVILDIDVKGFSQLRNADFDGVKPEIVSIFIFLPSIECLKERLAKREDKTNNLNLRIENARKELCRAGLYDNFVLNAEGLLQDSINDVIQIIGERES